MKRISFLLAVLMALITFTACAGGTSIPVEGKEVQANGGYYVDISLAQF